jgi:uncharacterized 2Fe-2S/4Fe-4S cluster protein (DUF4445 family)
LQRLPRQSFERHSACRRGGKILLTGAELAGGWRLACRHFIAGDLKLELAQWEIPILSDQSTFKFALREGLGAAIDLGTTTIAAQLLDLQTGGVLAVVTALNAQARHGGDIMSRVEFALRGGQVELQRVVRELQLAKGAIAAGLRMLAARFGASLDDIHQLHLAGAFGNYVNRTSAQRIGLLRVSINRVVPAGNTALLGAKRALFEDPAGWDAVARRVEHMALNEDKDFHDTYAEEMRFPA